MLNKTKLLISGALLGWITTNIDEVVYKELGVGWITSLIFVIGIVIYGILEYFEESLKRGSKS